VTEKLGSALGVSAQLQCLESWNIREDTVSKPS